jgi:tetratricopeptide (TPR) repeat protein
VAYPRSLDESSQQFDTFLAEMHEPFLERAGEEGVDDGGSTALGAFLALRFADRAADRADGMAEALAYQARATLDYLDDLEASPEVTHLVEITKVARAVARGKSAHLLCPPMLAFAYWLEQELRLSEALDVVDSVHRITGLEASDVVAATLQRARILRLSGRFDEARAAYAAAGTKAHACGDSHSLLLSRIGDAIVSRQVGNLPASEKALRAVLKDAEQLADDDAQARAHHDLGAALAHRGNHQQALVHYFAAFNLYQPESYRLRALSDVAQAMKALGQVDAATRAFTIVVERSTSPQVRAFAMVDLIGLAGMSGDRVSFHRWRGKIRDVADDLPAEATVDLEIALGLTYRAFGDLPQAQRHLRSAVHLAREWQLNEYLFRAERELEERQVGEDQEHRAPVSAAGREAAEVSAIADQVLTLSFAS